MTKKPIKRKLRNKSNKSQRGQILIIVVFAIVGLVSFVGLVVDTGLVFIGNGKLRRAVDAAALAAASQYRKDPNPYGLSKDAFNFLKLNNVDDPSATVFVCNPGYPAFHEVDLCTTPAKRRLVKVDATSTVNLAFLPVIGIRTITLHATATSEAASLDIVLAMDVSESMTWDNLNGSNQGINLMADPAECNNVASSTAPTNCQPFRSIQDAAVDFVSQLFPADGSNQYDRVSIIPFDRLAHATITGSYNDPLHLGYNSDNHLNSIQYRQKIIDTINSLRVYDASGSLSTGTPYTDGSCLDASGNLHWPGNAPCRYYPPNDSPYCFDQVTHQPLGLSNTPVDESVFDDRSCFTPTPAGDPHIGAYIRPSTGEHYERAYDLMSCGPGVESRYCGTTNTGGAFNAAGQEFVLQPGFRQESLWIVIMLTDGKANHSNNDYYCPNSDGSDCQDTNVKTINSGTRHCLTAGDPLYAGNPFLYSACITAPPDGGGGVLNVAQYDADDYARDMADFVALGQSALIYTIGFGDALHHGDPNSSGEQLLNYAADIGDNAKIDTPSGSLNSDYFFAHDATALATIFKTISDRIATRLTH
jgi:hypothetical protein